MNISNIKPGDVFKNYKALCEALEVDVKTGKSKQIQIQDISNAIEFKKIGHSFEIINIKVEKVLKKRHKGNTSPHIVPLKILLLSRLKEEGGYSLITKTDLAKSLKMINNKFSDFFYDRRDIAKKFQMDINIVNEFFDITRPGYEGAITTVLNQLKKANALHYDIPTMIIYYNEELQKNDTPVVATDKEIKSILQIKRQVMKNHGKHMQDIFTNGSFHKYNEELKEELFKTMKISNTYEVYKIISIEEGIQDELEYLLESSGINMKDISQIVETKWYDRNLSIFERRQSDAIKKSESRFGELPLPLSTRVKEEYTSELVNLHHFYTK